VQAAEPIDQHTSRNATLSRELIQELHQAAIIRIIESEAGVRRAGRHWLRVTLLPRLIQTVCTTELAAIRQVLILCVCHVQWDIDSAVIQRTMAHIFNDFFACQDLAIQWLYQEFQPVITARQARSDTTLANAREDKKFHQLPKPNKDRYHALLAQVLQGLLGLLTKASSTNALEQEGELFIETLLQLPYLPALDRDVDTFAPPPTTDDDSDSSTIPDTANVAHLIASICERSEPEFFQPLGFQTLYMLIRLRGASRERYEPLQQYSAV
jgi:hypothetical protein